MAKPNDPPLPSETGPKKEKIGDDLDRLAATRIVTVLEWPRLDGSGKWDYRVEYDESMSDAEAWGVLEEGKSWLSEHEDDD